ncbi:DUF397 domain-containing protein [Streptomyces sp. ME02-8801-2C]|uniref:DUF397 domain-containing protein n=1 Tax=Streptomyces sp. ME02-8801-2C TaxID=3028680 RepID=UPI0029B7BF5A|nr:DUF397 domain-containing protein [Streptomyces sp. ME02-8801-2C]MDX3454515.1 DUF397 domain-containing protein [Streptomyces sp. ME02-8801-2C]
MSTTPHPAPDFAWFKSSYSGGNTTECLEAAFTLSAVLIRDSKQPEHSHVVVQGKTWAGFLAGMLRAQ